jgi:hypothetical protein
MRSYLMNNPFATIKHTIFHRFQVAMTSKSYTFSYWYAFSILRIKIALKVFSPCVSRDGVHCAPFTPGEEIISTRLY